MRLARILAAVGLPLALVWWLFFGRPAAAPEPVAPAPASVSATPTTSPITRDVSTEPAVPQDSVTPSPSASPPIAGPSDPEVSRTDVTKTSKQFVQGWLTVNEKRRVRTLRPVTTEELLEGLATTRADNIPQAKPRGKPTMVRAAGGTVEVHQTFNRGDAIALLLIIDPSGRYGWRVSSVRPVD